MQANRFRTLVFSSLFVGASLSAACGDDNSSNIEAGAGTAGRGGNAGNAAGNASGTAAGSGGAATGGNVEQATAGAVGTAGTGNLGGTDSGSGGTTVGTDGGTAGVSTGGAAGATPGGTAGVANGGTAGVVNGGGASGSAGSANGGSAGSATGGSAGSATGGNAGSATGGNAGSATGGSAGTATGGNAGSATGGNAGSADGGSAGSDGASELCGGCVVLSAPFTAANQSAGLALTVDDGDIDLTGATITARMQLQAGETSTGGIQFFPRDTDGNSNWPWENLSDVGPAKTWVNVTYTWPGSGAPIPAHIHEIDLKIASGGAWSGAVFSTVTVWIDSVTITPVSGPVITYTFDTGSAPFAWWYGDTITSDALSWIP